MCRSRTNRTTRLMAMCLTAVGLGSWLGGCSDVYWDRRETLALGGGDAVAANEAIQTVDPWPPHSGDRNIAFNGQKMQGAVERYRTNKVAQPGDPTNLETSNQAGQSISQTTVNTGGAAAVSTPGQ